MENGILASLFRRSNDNANYSSSNDSSSSSSGSSSFIGNTPSTVLFFIALAVGVCIAILFIYFTLRYFIKTKYGVYIPSQMNNRNLVHPVMGGAAGMGANGRYGFGGASYASYGPLNDFADYTFHREFNALLVVRERRSLRRRYRKKRKLTKDEVDQLFPTKTYFEWEHGGKEQDQERLKGLIVHENDLEDMNREQDIEDAELEAAQVTEGEADITEMEDLSRSKSKPENSETTENTLVQEIDVTEAEVSDATEGSASAGAATDAQGTETEATEEPLASSSNNNTADHDELHFSSGMCAICIDDLEAEDQVRGLICGHVFHQECIDPWLINRKACCPMCKRDYYMKNQNGEGEEGEEGDGESILPLDSFADFILPRPIGYRARELLDALESHEGANRPISDNAEGAGGENPDGSGTSASPEAPTNDPQHIPGDIAIQDLTGIKELALLKLPSYFVFWKRPFWAAMGISREVMYDYLIVRIYEERRQKRLLRELQQSPQPTEQPTTNQPTTGQPTTESNDNHTRQIAEQMV